MSRKKRFWSLLAGVVCFCGAIVYFAPSIIGPMIDDYMRKSELEQSLSSCKPDEIIYVAYFHRQGKEIATFNFTKKELTGGEGEGGHDTWSWSGGSGKSIFYTIRLGNDKPYTDEQIQQIRAALAALPPPTSSPLKDTSYRDQLHLAFYRDDHLIIYHYPKYLAPPQLADLCKALKVSEHVE